MNSEAVTGLKSVFEPGSAFCCFGGILKMKTYQNGTLWHDKNGEEIHAHGGYIIQHEGFYYWYGEDRRENYYVSCYRSKDLVEWEFRNHILTTESKVEEYRVRTKRVLVHPDGKKVNIERPKVVYNKKYKKFVMWVHYENGNDYRDAAAAVATCDTPDGDFTYHGHFNPFGYMSRDCTLFIDDNETGYFISAARDNADLHVYRLSEDYLNVESLVHKLWQGEYREAPALIKHNQKYFMISSFCTGWNPNQGKYSVADTMEGTWTDLKEIGDETTYLSQPSFLLKANDQILYFGDRWGGDEGYFNSGYVVYPLEEKEGEWQLIEKREVIFRETGIDFQ